MISIVKYLSEMAERDYDENGNPTAAHYEALKRLKAKKALRAAPGTAPPPAERQDPGTTRKLFKGIQKYQENK